MCPGEICVVEKPQCYVPRSGGVNEKQCCRLPIDLMKKMGGSVFHMLYIFLLSGRNYCTYMLYAFGFEKRSYI